MKQPTSKILILLTLSYLALSGCSSSGAPSGADAESSFDISNNNFVLTLQNSQSFDTDLSYGVIDYYQIQILGEDLHQEFSQKIGDYTGEAQVLGIPVGTDRTLIVEAFNLNGQVIRRGAREGVNIIPGEITYVELSLNSVPIFVTPEDRSILSSSRLVFKIFAEPDSQLKIFQNEISSETTIKDRVTDSSFVNTQATQGLYEFSPQITELGSHTFILQDQSSHESSEIILTVNNKTLRPGIGIYSAASVNQSEHERIMSNSGQFYYQSLEDDPVDLSQATLWDVWEVMF